MKRLIAVLMLTLPLATLADQQNIILDLPTMNCAMCPITVKTALMNTDGVLDVDVTYADKKAKVSFENTLVSTQALIDATTNAGYPSTLITLP